MALGVQDATRLYIRHGLGMQRLKSISNEEGTGNIETLVSRWQKMMETFLGTQVHVLAGLGYTVNETGLALYNQQLATLVQTADPDSQEKLRINGRDIWREVLTSTFHLTLEDIKDSELNSYDARNVMHKVSQKMIEPQILESISHKCSSILTDSTSDPTTSLAQKHQIVQDILVKEVYLGGEPSLVKECGFGSGEKGYILMQCVMAEHQSDPLVAQYVGSSMMQVLKSAGLDMETLQKAAAAAASK
eukprot:CAMPEP_0184862324 /NCGR_PEP_ID=MMETSP0580-20130426/6797_1 /TAXON_ID=1118495 /ORGANISM="Dactyliosolen fragilissimus" /LENGTH=246 /DNA_ID=CAMNT_0027360133 /DNA_START=157 /DNA_END=897 /DNA_ORIENTATION=+